jgi:hypothetical protein
MTSISLTGATNASPIVITTSSPHGIVAGSYRLVQVSGVGGNTAANGLWRAAYASTTTLTLEGSAGNGAYSAASGVMTPVNFGVKVMAEDGLSDRFAVFQVIGASADLRSKDVVANDNEFFTLHSIVLAQKAQNTWSAS